MIKQPNNQKKAISDTDIVDAHSWKNILFVGSNGKEICEELFSFGYAGLSLPSFSNKSSRVLGTSFLNFSE